MQKAKKYILKLSIGLSLFFGGCSAMDEPVPDKEFEVPEGMVKVSMLIPDYNGGAAKFGTRAFDTNEEGYMTNLYVVAIKYKELNEGIEYELSEDDRVVYVHSLNSVGETFKVGNNDFHQFNIALYPGIYKIGVIANVDLYLSERATKISDFKKESDMQSIVLNFKEDTPLAPRHLPMVCLPEETKYKIKTTTITTDNSGKSTIKTEYSKDFQKGETDDNLITIQTKQSEIKDDDGSSIKTYEENVIYASMKFLCSKVRYTILFDKTEGGISEAFGSSWIRFNVDDRLKPWATNIRYQTRLLPEKTDGDIFQTDSPFITQTSTSGDIENSSWTISIDRFNWSTIEGANYPLSPNSKLDPWTGTTEKWISQTQKVWQGVVYLPENIGGEEYTVEGVKKQIESTVLKFPYHTKENDSDETLEIEHSLDPKEIWLFQSPNNISYDKFEGLGEGGDYSTKPGEYLGLERNYFYDVVAKVVNPDDPMNIRVYVNILPWHDIDQNLDEDWLYNDGQKPSENFFVQPDDWGDEGASKEW
ncbi:MAG: hypothetical protein J1E82_04265 [Muribaculaceae bacterium]|nr:hypothetical protein [Muribaculaceae bacterium]